jgi:hypothetical protein
MNEMQGWKKETDRTGLTTYYKTLGPMANLIIEKDKSKFRGQAFGVDRNGMVEVFQDDHGIWHKRISDLAPTPTGDTAIEGGDRKSQTKYEEKIPKIGTIEKMAIYLESLVPKTE